MTKTGVIPAKAGIQAHGFPPEFIPHGDAGRV